MNQYPKHMKISELCARSKKTAATIRYYARQGLLPKPVKTSKTMAYYTVEHLERLNQIDVLQKEGHSLDEISQVVNGNTGKDHPDEKPETIFSSKRDVIIKAAADLFRERGYDPTSIDDIVARAGIGKGTFYQYFKGKEQLFHECAGHVFYDIARDEPAIKDETDVMKRLWNRAYSFVHTHLHMLDMLNLARAASIKDKRRSQKTLDEALHNLIDPIEADLNKAIMQGKLRYNDLHVLAYLLMGATEYAYYYMQIHPELDKDVVLAKGWNIVWNGLLSGEEHEKT